MIIPRSYKWLPIIRKHKLKWYAWVNATYDLKTQTITVYDRMTNKTKDEIYLVLYHEWCHHIYMTKVSKTIKIIWKLISNWRLRNMLNILLWTDYKENAYVSWASKSNVNEDFARSLAQGSKHWKYNNYIDNKKLLATNILNYFSKK